MRAVRRLTALYIVLVFAAACSSPSGTGVQHDLAMTVPDIAVPGRVYQVEKVTGCGQAGYQSQIALAPDGTTVGVVTIASTVNKGTCTPSMRPPMQAPLYDICFAESAAGGAFKTTKVTSEIYIALAGVALAYSPAGDAYVAYTGNAAGVKPAEFRCGASNLLMVSGKGGKFGAPKAIATSSQSAALVPDQKSNCIQNVCNSGDAVGYWPAVAFSPSTGDVGLAWRDTHFGFAVDDFASSDVEYATGPGFSDLTIDVSRGGGNYNHLYYRKSGLAVVVHQNGEGGSPQNHGIWLNQDTGGGAWASTLVTHARAGEMIGFAVSTGGRFGLAYYDADGLKLEYMESMDGQTWSTPVDVDTDGVTGQFPSLAFDAAGEPVIAYYRCRDYDPRNSSCDMSQDGLRIARRSGMRWQVESVTAQSGLFDGLYPALAIAGGKAVIAYQTISYDQRSNTNSLELDVAREQ